MKVVSIRKRRRSSAVLVTLDDESTIELPTEVVLSEGLRKGVDIDQRSLQRIQGRASLWKCKEDALSLLSYRPRAAAELKTRLRRKEHDPEVIDDCLADLDRSGLIDDAAFADMAARDRLRSRPMGSRLLEQELRAKGVGAEVASDSAARAAASLGESEVELARRAALKFRRKKGEEERSTQRRFFAFLGRRGFPSDVIRQVMDETDFG